MTSNFLAFSSSTDAANLVHYLALTGVVPTILPLGVIPLRKPVEVRDMNGIITRHGKAVSRMRFDLNTFTQKRTLERYLWGTTYPQTTASKKIAFTARDEDGFFSTFTAIVSAPQSENGMQLFLPTVLDFYELKLFDIRLQTFSKSLSGTNTASERMLLVDTTAGSVTRTLPAANAVQANTIVTHIKLATANNMVIQRAGSDTLDGGTSITKTGLLDRVDLVSNGVNAWRSIVYA